MPLLPVHTRGEGDCAFHAAFGQWDDKAQEFVHQDIQALRKRVADTVRISIAGQLIFPSIIAAIDELIRATSRPINLTGLPTLQNLRAQFQTGQSVALDWTNRNIIEEYARIIETPGIWLLPAELSIIAHACQISIRHFLGENTNPIQIQEHNPGHRVVNIYFDGRNHYEAMRENGVFHPSYPAHRMDIDPPPSATLLQVGNYAASGLKHTFHGNVYQLKLLMLFLYRGYKNQYQFKLATEMDDAEKFDDLVFEYKKPGDVEPSYFFLQAKHKQDDNQLITDTELLDTREGEFSLAKYFLSFQKISSNPLFQNGAQGKFYLCTNIGLDLDPLRNAERILRLDDAFELVTTPDIFLGTNNSKAKRYRLKRDGFSGKALLCGVLRGDQKLILARSLLAVMQNPTGKVNKIHSPFNDKTQYQWLIDQHILDDQTRRLSGTFIAGRYADGKALSNDASNFRNLYHQVATGNNTVWSDPEIEAFLDQLVFAVNQPNEVRLGEIIARELGNEFNLINSDFIYAELQKAVLDWMKQKTGSFLSGGSAEKFFQTIRQKLSQFVLMGSTIEQQEKLKQYDIAFNPVASLRDFLQGTHQKLIYQTSGDVLLSTLQVYQTLQGIPKYQKNDSYIFITLKGALALWIKEILNNTSTQLLILICEAPPTQEEINQLTELLVDKEQAFQKILFLTRDGQQLRTALSREKLPLINAVHNFASLTPSSQQKLQAWPIVFQGQPTTLGELVPDVASLIDTDVLTELLLHKEIYIGQELKRFEAEYYYIERTFLQKAHVKSSFLRNKEIDFFILDGIDKDQLEKLVGKESKIIQLSEKNIEQDLIEYRYILIDQQNSFETVCESLRSPINSPHSSPIIVHLTWENGDFIFRRTYLDKENEIQIPKYIKRYTRIDDLPRLTILSDPAGMGKTTILSHAFTELKKSNPTLWIIKINLLEQENLIKSTDFTSLAAAIDFLANKPCAIAAKILENRLLHTGNVAIFLDGFDEIKTPQQDKIMQLLHLLQRSKAKKIIVTTRPHLQGMYYKLGIAGYHNLRPFEPEEGKRFLLQFWQKSLALGLLDIDRVGVYADRLTSSFSRSTKDKEREFIGIPLQANLLATAFLEDFQTFYTSSLSEPQLPEHLSLPTLYHRFIETKYEILFKEKFGADSYNAFSYIKHSLTAILEECHQLLAFNFLFPEFKYAEEKVNLHIELIKRAGLVQLNEGKSHEFIHRTFAEYFAAGFLLDRLQDPSFYQKTRAFLIGHIFKDQHKVIRSFIEGLTQESQNAELTQAWQAIVTGQLLASRPINPLLTLVKHTDSSAQPQHDMPPKDIEHTFIQIREAFEEHIRQFDLNKSRQSTYNFCNALLKIQNLDQVTASLALLGEAIKKSLSHYINDLILDLLPEIFWHYLTLCHKQKSIFDHTLLQAFRNAQYSSKGRLKYTTMENECLDQLNQLHHYMTISQTIDPQFVEELDLAKVLYLVFGTPSIPWELVEPLSKQLQNVYPQLKPYLINNKFYQKLMIKLPCIYPAFTQGVKAFLLEPKNDYSLQGKMGELIYQLYRVKPETRPTPEEMEHIFTHAPRYSFACSSEEAISLIYCFKLLTPKLGKNISAELFSAISAKTFGNDVAAERYNETVWNRLLLPLLHELQPHMLTDGIDPIALLSLCSDFFAYARGSEINRQFSLSTLALQNLLQLLEQTLNQPKLSAKTFFRCMWLLTQLNYEGFHLLDLGAAIVVQHPTAEFEYPLQLIHKKPIFNLLSLRPKPTSQDVEVFAPACADTLQTIRQTRPKLKRTTSNPEISPSAERKVEVVSLSRNIKRGRSGAEEPDMDYPLASKRHKHRGMEEKSEV